MRPYWPLAVCGILLTVLGSAIGLLSPWPMSFLVDSVLGNHSVPHWMSRWFGLSDHRGRMVYFVVFGGLAIALVGDLLSMVENYLLTKLDQSMTLDFRSDMFRHASGCRWPSTTRSAPAC